MSNHWDDAVAEAMSDLRIARSLERPDAMGTLEARMDALLRAKGSIQTAILMVRKDQRYQVELLRGGIPE